MGFYKCPKCHSENVSNYPLNTDEYGNPDDCTYQGCCNNCEFEEPYHYNKEGRFYYIDYQIEKGETHDKLEHK